MKPILILLISILLFAQLATSAEKCKKFVCKSFDKGPDDLCVKINTSAGADQLVRNCNKDQGCSAKSWTSVEKAELNGYCGKIQPYTPINVTMPGDLCNEAKECYGKADQVSCDKVCYTTVKVGDDCNEDDGQHPGDYTCPVGAYCDITKKKCAAQKAEGEVCSSRSQCTTGFNCIKESDKNDFVCTKYWTLKYGIKFDVSYAKYRHIFLPFSAVCGSHWAVQVDGSTSIYECRAAPANNNATDLDSLKRMDGAGSVCEYTVYDDKEDYKKAVVKQGTAVCGFNKDDAAYCAKQQGDQWFKKQLDALKSTNISDVKCHTYSDLSICEDAMNTIGHDLYKQLYREVISTPEGVTADQTSYALYANNDKCVANSITAFYWQGDSPDSAFNLFTMTSLAALLSMSLALFMA